MTSPTSTLERELVDPIDVACPDGTLRRDAIGWARHPIHRCNLARTLPRVHTWSYWCITSRTAALTLLVADVGFASVVLVSFLELSARAPIERVYVRPGGLPLFEPAPRGDFAIDVRRLRLSMRNRGDSMAIEGEARTLLGARIGIDLVVERPVAHETVNVLVPWDDTRFHFTSKQQALRARGEVRVGRKAHAFTRENQGFACLDFGHGRRPQGIDWRWAFASSERDGRTVGLNLGGTWTDGTGVTENGLVIDGRVHKVSEAVDFDYDRRAFTRPWRITTSATDRLDLRFVPLRERAVQVPLGLLSMELHQCVGAFTGTFVDDGGQRVGVEDALGVAESFRARW